MPDKKAKNGFSVQKKLEQMSSTQQRVWDALFKNAFTREK